MNENIDDNREETAQDAKIVNSSLKKKINIEMTKKNKNNELFEIDNQLVEIELKEIVLNELQNATKCIDDSFSLQSQDNISINKQDNSQEI